MKPLLLATQRQLASALKFVGWEKSCARTWKPSCDPAICCRQERRTCPQYVADPVSLHCGYEMDLHDRVPFNAIDSIRSYISQIRQRELDEYVVHPASIEPNKRPP